MDWVKFNSRKHGSRFSLAVKAILFTLKRLSLRPSFSPHFRLVRLALNADMQEYVVTLKLKGCKHLEIKDVPASLISRDMKLIKQLSPEDANRIGYMAGMNDATKSALLK